VRPRRCDRGYREGLHPGVVASVELKEETKTEPYRLLVQHQTLRFLSKIFSLLLQQFCARRIPVVCTKDFAAAATISPLAC
jgi:hypothetical protein